MTTTSSIDYNAEILVLKQLVSVLVEQSAELRRRIEWLEKNSIQRIPNEGG